MDTDEPTQIISGRHDHHGARGSCAAPPPRRCSWVAALAIFALTSAVVAPSRAALAALLVVNSTDDTDDGTCDATHCSLREAIEASEATPGVKDTIAFAIAGVGPHTIQPLSPLPTMLDPVAIDGYTQPGAQENANPVGMGLNTVLQVVLDGSLLGLFPNGLDLEGGDSTVKGLAIGNWRGSGILLVANFQANFMGGNHIEGNFIGTDASGTVDMGNVGNGVRILGSPDNVVGGTTPAARNLISGNGGDGVAMNFAFPGPTGNRVEGNLIGTDVTGTAKLPNDGDGVSLVDDDNVVGGAAAGARNVLSGNGFDGVFVQGGMNNTVQGNLIGTDVTGQLPLGNGDDGVDLCDGPTGAMVVDNVIADNLENGITIEDTEANFVLGNLIGTDADGVDPLGNAQAGLNVIDSANNHIGGAAPGEANVIAASGGNGLEMIGTSTFGNLIRGNFIGTDITGTADLGNAGHGVAAIGSGPNSIGGTEAGAGNTIAFNVGDGVAIVVAAQASTGKTILGNSIFDNLGLGIDLGDDGVTANDVPLAPDPPDIDVGANNLQNYPVLSSAVTDVTTTVEGLLQSTPETTFRIEFFASAALDPSGNGEGEIPIGAREVVTDADGDAPFNFVAPVPVAPGLFITATATPLDEGEPVETSEFSAGIVVEGQTTTSTTTTTTAASTTTTTAASTTTTAAVSTTTTTAVSTTTTTAASTTTTTTTTAPPTTTTSTVTVTTTSTTSGTTATTLPGLGGCPIEATFESLNCRLDALIERLEAETDLGKLKTRMLKQARGAKKFKERAEDRCRSGSRKKTGRELRKAVSKARGLRSLLRSNKSRKTITSGLRTDLLGVADPIHADLKTLKKTVDCPADAPAP
jgi:CSLREA domain-containing protein